MNIPAKLTEQELEQLVKSQNMSVLFATSERAAARLVYVEARIEAAHQFIADFRDSTIGHQHTYQMPCLCTQCEFSRRADAFLAADTPTAETK